MGYRDWPEPCRGTVELADYGTVTGTTAGYDMTKGLFAQIFIAASITMLLAALFTLYQNPLFEIYLTNWGLC